MNHCKGGRKTSCVISKSFHGHGERAWSEDGDLEINEKFSFIKNSSTLELL